MSNRVFEANWLRDVPNSAIDKLRRACSTVVFPNRSVIYRIGGEQECLWGVQSGQVRVHVSLNELEPILGHIHLTGTWFGESEPLLQVPGLVEMQAAEDTSVVRIEFVAFRKLANESPSLWEALARLTSMNQVLAMAAANDLVLKTGRMRLAAVLLRLSGHRANLQGSPPSGVVFASQQEIANLSNVSLSMASDQLRAFSGADMIRLEYGRVLVLDPDGLQSVIDV